MFSRNFIMVQEARKRFDKANAIYDQVDIFVVHYPTCNLFIFHLILVQLFLNFQT